MNVAEIVVILVLLLLAFSYFPMLAYRLTRKAEESDTILVFSGEKLKGQIDIRPSMSQAQIENQISDIVGEARVSDDNFPKIPA